jgi:hypothetical protein
MDGLWKKITNSAVMSRRISRFSMMIKRALAEGSARTADLYLNLLYYLHFYDGLLQECETPFRSSSTHARWLRSPADWSVAADRPRPRLLRPPRGFNPVQFAPPAGQSSR